MTAVFCERETLLHILAEDPAGFLSQFLRDIELLRFLSEEGLIEGKGREACAGRGRMVVIFLIVEVDLRMFPDHFPESRADGSKERLIFHSSLLIGGAKQFIESIIVKADGGKLLASLAVAPGLVEAGSGACVPCKPGKKGGRAEEILRIERRKRIR